MKQARLDGRTYARFIAAGADFVRKYRAALNALNVFPVPDGDTGSNMHSAARQAAVEAGRHRSEPLAAVASAAARGALLGARGNSGVLFSQLLRGFAQGVHSETAGGEPAADLTTIARAMEQAARTARSSVSVPVEGTILSIADAAAAGASRVSFDAADIRQLLRAAVESAASALDRTPDQLPLLKEAGVVDAGGAGLLYFMEGALRLSAGEAATRYPHDAGPAVFASPRAIDGKRFCVEFMLERTHCSAAEVRVALERIGDSLVIGGETPSLKVHLHAGDPQSLQRLAGRFGDVTRWKIDDMQAQQRAVAAAQRGYGVVAVVPGHGFERIARELGADVTITATGDPSVAELAEALRACNSNRVYLFANDANAIAAAREAAQLADGDVTVVPTRDAVSGIAGLLALQSCSDAADIEQIRAEAEHPRSARVFFAGKEASVGGTTVARGRPAALFDGRLYPGDTLQSAASEALRAMGAANGGLVTLYYGGAQTDSDAQQLRAGLQRIFPSAEVQAYFGGQPSIEYWISSE